MSQPKPRYYAKVIEVAAAGQVKKVEPEPEENIRMKCLEIAASVLQCDPLQPGFSSRRLASRLWKTARVLEGFVVENNE